MKRIFVIVLFIICLAACGNDISYSTTQITEVESDAEPQGSILYDLDLIKIEIEKTEKHIVFIPSYTYFLIKTDSIFELAGETKQICWFDDIYFYAPPLKFGEWYLARIPAEYTGEVYMVESDIFTQIR